MNEFDELGRTRESWIFIGLALWGGLCHYLGGVRSRKRPLSLFELAGDLVYAGFAGVIAIAFAKNFGLNDWQTGLFAGISGHMGSRSIFLFERWLKEKLKLDDPGV
jgi:hypothetical protein